MAPTKEQVLDQTQQIVFYLFEDGNRAQCQGCDVDMIEHDGPEDDFDPAMIADKLRQVADSLNEDARFMAALTDLQQAAAQEVVDAAFGTCVEVVCQTQVAQTSDIAPEVQLIRTAVAFGLYVKKSSPNLKGKVQNAMVSFFSHRVGSWVIQQGGWDKVPI